jgi:hypothetical protein
MNLDTEHCDDEDLHKNIESLCERRIGYTNINITLITVAVILLLFTITIYILFKQ